MAGREAGVNGEAESSVERTPAFRRALNKATHRLVIYTVGVIGLLSLIGNYLLPLLDKPVPPLMEGIPDKAVLGLLALLGRPGSDTEHVKMAPQEVITPPGTALTTAPISQAPAKIEPEEETEEKEGEG